MVVREFASQKTILLLSTIQRKGQRPGQGRAQVLEVQCKMSPLRISPAGHTHDPVVFWTLVLRVCRLYGIVGTPGERDKPRQCTAKARALSRSWLKETARGERGDLQNYSEPSELSDETPASSPT